MQRVKNDLQFKGFGPDAVLLSAAAVSMNPTLAPLDQKISKYTGGKPIRIDGSPKASGILETVSSSTVTPVIFGSLFGLY